MAILAKHIFEMNRLPSLHCWSWKRRATFMQDSDVDIIASRCYALGQPSMSFDVVVFKRQMVALKPTLKFYSICNTDLAHLLILRQPIVQPYYNAEFSFLPILYK